jgi:hypothetical protein
MAWGIFDASIQAESHDAEHTIPGSARGHNFVASDPGSPEVWHPCFPVFAGWRGGFVVLVETHARSRI